MSGGLKDFGGQKWIQRPQNLWTDMSHTEDAKINFEAFFYFFGRWRPRFKKFRFITPQI